VLAVWASVVFGQMALMGEGPLSGLQYSHLLGIHPADHLGMEKFASIGKLFRVDSLPSV
jgi:hypothetical protein